MTTFDDREQAFENKFAHEQDINFRVVARRNKLLGLWAAERLSLTPAEADAYAKSVVQAEFEESGDEDVVRKLVGDLARGGIDVSEAEVRARMDAAQAEARQQVMDGR